MLVAVLLNPPSNSAGLRSRNAVAIAARVLGYERVVVANLCAAPTPSVVELNAVDAYPWDVARRQLVELLKPANALLAAWGVAGLHGRARQLRDDQVNWLEHEAGSAGLTHEWMLGGRPLHPSRWHQFVSDKYGRTSGGSFEQRIGQVLVSVPLRLAKGAELNKPVPEMGVVGQLSERAVDQCESTPASPELSRALASASGTCSHAKSSR